MPELDVSEVLLDPMLADRFTVYRRADTVTDKGRSNATETPIPNIVGVVTMAGPDDLDRLDDQQRMGKVISVVTKYRLRGPAKDDTGQQYQPDVICWVGTRYVVTTLDPYTRYGAGFVQALAVATAAVQRPPA